MSVYLTSNGTLLSTVMDDYIEDGCSSGRRPNSQQACETCRSRKVKCDGSDPCAVCYKLNVECLYRETKPTKKDKTLVYILDTIKSLESKVDRALASKHPPSPSTARPSSSKLLRDHSAGSSSRFSSSRGTPPSLDFGGLSVGHLHSNRSANGTRVEARKVISWPAIHTLLSDDIAGLVHWDPESDSGERWRTKITRDFVSALPVDEPVNFSFIGGAGLRAWEAGTVYLTKSIVEDYCGWFFCSLHAIYPILDPRHFYAVTLPQAYQAFFDQYDQSSCLVMVILALGAVAKEGVSGVHLLELSGRRTGVRGGSPERPPGLAFSNEAKRRLGLMMTQHDLPNLQSFLLLSVYYAQISRNLDYWHLTTFSTAVCSSVARTVDNWKTSAGDLVARAFWMCILMQGGLITELGFHTESLQDLINDVPFPFFLPSTAQEAETSSGDLFIHLHFLAQITLRAQLDRIQSSLRTYKNPFHSDDSEDTVPTTLISELLRQLHAWRATLPPQLTWTDSDSIDTRLSSPISPIRMKEQPQPDMTAILGASLRTRYKYAEYLIWRPYLYKVLHFPQSTTEADFQGCRNAFKACSSWPLTQSYFQEQRRIIPHLYEYTHCMFGILVLLHACAQNPLLSRILLSEELCLSWEQSKAALLCWMRDMQIVHSVARWGWQLLRIIYADEPGVKDFM